MVTPILNVSTDPQCRDHVRATWKCLTRNYAVSGNNACSTHVHVSSQSDYSLADVKRIASSVIYFEPSFEVLIPECRRGNEDEGNEYARSNWLNSSEGRTRFESTDEIL